jgi:hypothetical protein
MAKRLIYAMNNEINKPSKDEFSFVELLIKTFPEFSRSSFTEFNFSNPYWKNYFKTNKIELTISESFRRLFSILISYISNILSITFVCLFLKKKNNVPMSYKYFVYCNSCNFSQIDGSTLYYRYTGEVLNKSEATYVVSLLDKNETKWNSIIQIVNNKSKLDGYNNIYYLESDLSLNDIISLFIFPKYTIRLFILLSNNYSIIISLLITLEFILIDNSKMELKEKLVERLVNKSDCLLNIVLFYELVSGRSITKVLRDKGKRVHGLQHGSNGPLHKFRFAYSQEVLARCRPSCIPDCILVEGKEDYDLIKGVNLNTSIVGAARIKRFPKGEYIPNQTILILLDMHCWQEYMNEISKLIKRSDYGFIIRMHPSQKLSTKYKDFQIDHTKSLESSIKFNKPLAVLATDTGAVLEVINAGIPVFLFNNARTIMNSPLIHSIEDSSLFYDSNLRLDKFISNNKLSKELYKEIVQSKIYCIGRTATQNIFAC